MAKIAQIKTKPTEQRVEDFINALPDEQKRKDSFALLELMQKVSGEEPKMWGASMIGFGDKRYKSPATGREVDWFKVGFAPRKSNITLYLITSLQEQAAALQKLGKHKIGGGCLYINKLADVDLKVLATLIKASLKSK